MWGGVLGNYCMVLGVAAVMLHGLAITYRVIITEGQECGGRVLGNYCMVLGVAAVMLHGLAIT